MLTTPALVVIGGGEAGVFHVRQLLRASAAGRLGFGRVVVVDRDPGCAARRHASDPRVRVEVGDWGAWLDRNLLELPPEAQLVPYHWAPHLLLGWLAREAEAHGALVARGGSLPARGLPLERDTREGDRALSHAAWICPPTCIEPALCPHTRGPKHWSLAAELALAGGSDGVDEAIVLPSLHFVHGVATISVGRIQEGRRRVIAGLARGPRRYLVATSSHCHALASLLHVAPRS